MSGAVVWVDCPTCFIHYAIPAALNARALEEKQKFRGVWCPAGHSWTYTGEREADIQRRRADNAIQQNARLQAEAAAARAERDKAVVSLKRHKKRTVAGLCPCCNRSFVRLANHITTKHPEYKAEAA